MSSNENKRDLIFPFLYLLFFLSSSPFYYLCLEAKQFAFNYYLVNRSIPSSLISGHITVLRSELIVKEYKDDGWKRKKTEISVLKFQLMDVRRYVLESYLVQEVQFPAFLRNPSRILHSIPAQIFAYRILKFLFRCIWKRVGEMGIAEKHNLSWSS